MKNVQTTDHLLMITPVGFCSNPDTAGTNAHQAENPRDLSEIRTQAMAEHAAFQNLLRDNGVRVTVFDGTPECPDDVFCNNWFSTHQDQSLCLYPMLGKNRRLERRTDIIDVLKEKYTLKSGLSSLENEGMFLEGTGSLVLDHVHKIAYAALSPRTDAVLTRQWCQNFDYTPCFFESTDKTGTLEYHTNVVLFVGSSLAGFCPENIQDMQQQKKVRSTLSKRRVLLELSSDQINAFAGNALEVKNKEGQRILVLSQTGWDSLNDAQKELVHTHVDRVLTPKIPTLETYGGGSARCCLGELF
ncbi:MAG: amidinotransferase [bacterium]|nr:amidinotransferase [bacterium]